MRSFTEFTDKLAEHVMDQLMVCQDWMNDDEREEKAREVLERMAEFFFGEYLMRGRDRYLRGE